MGLHASSPGRSHMIERHLVVPAPPTRVWEALTEPGALAGWFGARVEWDLRPGGGARFFPQDADDGPERSGVVTSVHPERHLVFRWWPDGNEDDASEVRYRLEPEPDGEGTRLTVTEERVRRDGAPGGAGGEAPAACA